MGDGHPECDTSKHFMKLKNDLGTEDVHYSIFYDGIPNEFKDLAREQLNETEENKRMGLLKLRIFLNGKGISGVEDYILITVLRNCKYNIKKSEKKLLKFLQTQDMVTRWLQTTDLERLETVLNYRFVGFLPYREKHGRAIVYTTPYDIDQLFDLEDAKLCCLCILLYLLTFPLTSILGVVYIGESKASSKSILLPVMKAYVQFLPTILSLPVRISKIEVINENFIIRWAYNIARSILPTKILQRLQFHGSDIQSLQDFYHPALLPEEFGGTMGPMNPKFFMENFINFVKKLKCRKLFL